jgi:hypothetical protein
VSPPSDPGPRSGRDTAAALSAADAAAKASPTASATVGAAEECPFKRALAQNPKDLFDRSKLSAAEQARLDKFPCPDCGASVQTLKPMEGQSIDEIKKELAKQGFQEVPRSPSDQRVPPDMQIFLHPDGGLVKIKPNGDGAQFTKFGRAGPMVSREVVTDPTATGAALTGFKNAAFKVTDSGRPIPKMPDQIKHPPEAMRDDAAKESFNKSWADSGHAKPATPPGFAQRTTND